MTPTALQNYLDTKVKYKNAFFKVSRNNISDQIIIKMHIMVKDACSGYSYNQAPEIPLTTVDMIAEWQLEQMNEQEINKYIYYMIRRLEMHEIDEHFKINNICYNEPHPEKLKLNKVDFFQKI